jgi:hypothetical protein
MEVKINLSLDREEAKSLFRHLIDETTHTDWDTLNKITDELEKVLNVKECEII